MKCLECGCEVDAGMKFCGECGSPMPQNKRCPKCGSEVPERMKFCGECGYGFADKATASGLAMGDKNVIAGDVVGHQESYSISGNATIVKNEDETKKMVECHVCGRHIMIMEAFTCPQCHNVTCHDCYVKDRRVCRICSSSIDSDREENYRSALARVYSDGKVELSERNELNALKRDLGLTDARAAEIERAFSMRLYSTNALGQYETMCCVKAEEMLFDLGDAKGALEQIEPVYNAHPQDERVLSVYLPALSLVDDTAAKNVMMELHIDSSLVAITHFDIDFRNKNYVEAELRIKNALALWPDNLLVKCRYALLLYMTYQQFNVVDALTQAINIVRSMDKPANKMERSWLCYIMSVMLPDLPSDVNDYAIIRPSGSDVYAALCSGEFIGVDPTICSMLDACLKKIALAQRYELSEYERHAIGRASSVGDSDATLVLGWYEAHNGVDGRRGVELVRQVAEAGNACAELAYGLLLKEEADLRDWMRKLEGYMCEIRKVDRVRIWRHIVTAADINQLFNGVSVDGNGPLVNISWDECSKLIQRINELERTRLCGLKFRLPDESELEFVYERQLDRGGRLVFRDWTNVQDGIYRIARGGDYLDRYQACGSADRMYYLPTYRGATLGFRLVCEGWGQDILNIQADSLKKGN